MNVSIIILKKELLEIFRDKFTFMILFVPIVAFPFFNIAMNCLNNNTSETIKMSITSIDIEGERIFESFIKNSNLVIERIDVENSVEAQRLLNNEEIDCYLHIENQKYSLTYNSSSYQSLLQTAKLGESFSEFYSSLYSQLNDDFYIMNICDESGNVFDSNSSLSNLFIPVMIMLFITQGITNYANDMFAGERERKTLELLFLSGAKKSSLYFGKSLALFVISIINCFLCIVSFFISSELQNNGMKQFKFMQNGLVELNIMAIIISLVLLAGITVFLSLTISMVSPNIRNAQMLNELVVSVPVLFTLLLSLGIIKINTIFSYIPVLNLVVCFVDAFSGKASLLNVFQILIINVILVIALIYLSLQYLKTEKAIR